mmetsp:Transcript_8203/g.22259  ORF Transcript_8203/g.22259 Transcript_8203/m.22259 type:complete len:228 (-) Transcript_8203:37-720(-)
MRTFPLLLRCSRSSTFKITRRHSRRRTYSSSSWVCWWRRWRRTRKMVWPRRTRIPSTASSPCCAIWSQSLIRDLAMLASHPPVDSCSWFTSGTSTTRVSWTFSFSLPRHWGPITTPSRRGRWAISSTTYAPTWTQRSSTSSRRRSTSACWLTSLHGSRLTADYGCPRHHATPGSARHCRTGPRREASPSAPRCFRTLRSAKAGRCFAVSSATGTQRRSGACFMIPSL